ncbi:MAG TPA: Tad domain-containing protein [Rhodopila sp.]|nr:Tad domain-containing protein [Rhodopila sp.]
MWKKLLRARKASVITIVAMSSLAIIAMAAFSVDLGNAYSALSQDQRVADIAAYSGALAYNNTGDSTAITNAVSRIATLNGLSANAISATMTTSPTGDGNNAIHTQVTTSNPIYFASAIGAGKTISVGSTSYAEIRAGTPGCITALQTSGAGISVTGGTSITANACAVASNGTVPGQNTSVYVHCGAKLTTRIVDYASGKAPVQDGCTDIYPPTGTQSVTFTHTTSTDKLATNGTITTATSRLGTVAAITSPSAPVVTGGTAISLGYSSSPLPTVPSGCTPSFSSPVWTISCPSAGTYIFGPITLGGGITLNLNWNAATANRTFVFNGDINGTSGSAINLGAGNYTISGGIAASGSMVITWQGNGAFKVGTATSAISTSACPAGYSICVSGSSRIYIPGPSSFQLAGGIYQNASGTQPNPALWLGATSTANSYTIGKGGNGYSIYAGNGATILADASTSSKTVSLAGNVFSAGGTCLALPAAGQHDINGSLNAAGGVYLGSGIYTLTGYAAFGANSGGDVGNCPSQGVTTGVGGLGVSLILGGNSTISCGSTASAFCLGAGYSTVNLVAPTSTSTLGSSTAGVAVVGPTTSSLTGAAVFTSGATNTRISGVFYFPYGAINVSGGASLQDSVDSGACLELVGAQISLSGGGVLGSTCTGLPGSVGGVGSSIAIVQ